MKIIKITKNSVKKLPSSAMALGFFDGIHLGHQKIINKTIKIANAKNLKSAVLTFDKVPRDILNKNKSSNIFGISDKSYVLEKMGIDYMVVIKIDYDFLTKTTAKEFVTKILLKLNVLEVICGEDFGFGAKKSGKINDIEKFSNGQIKVNSISFEKRDNKKISSSQIKEYLSQNNITMAKKLLGRSFTIHGKVIHGSKKGRDIGFKTANIEIKDSFTLLLNGVFAVNVIIDGSTYHAIANVGYKPTFKSSKAAKNIEAYIFNFDSEIYNQKIIVEFKKFIRKEKKFSSASELAKQITKDVFSVKKYFKIK